MVDSISEVNPLNAVLSDPLSSIGRFIPEPQSNLGTVFRSMLSSVLSSLGDASASFSAVNPEYQLLLQQQIELQRQMQLVSLYSNLEKSKHDTAMAPIRNIKVE